MAPEPDSTKESMRRTLESWEVNAASDPDFQRSVWKKVSARSDSEPNPITWWIAQVSRPRVATVLAVLTVLLASVGAFTKSRIDVEAGMNRLERKYVASIDPILKFTEGTRP